MRRHQAHTLARRKHRDFRQSLVSPCGVSRDRANGTPFNSAEAFDAAINTETEWISFTYPLWRDEKDRRVGNHATARIDNGAYNGARKPVVPWRQPHKRTTAPNMLTRHRVSRKTLFWSGNPLPAG